LFPWTVKSASTVLLEPGLKLAQAEYFGLGPLSSARAEGLNKAKKAAVDSNVVILVAVDRFMVAPGCHIFNHLCPSDKSALNSLKGMAQ
jgi:hypothetical protein